MTVQTIESEEDKDCCEDCSFYTYQSDYPNPYYCLYYKRELTKENGCEKRPDWCITDEDKEFIGLRKNPLCMRVHPEVECEFCRYRAECIIKIFNKRIGSELDDRYI